MGKTKIQITDYEDRISAQGKPFVVFKTSQGPMSCFEEDVADEIKESFKPDDWLVVEVKESKDGAFKNIRKVYDEAEVVKMPKMMYESAHKQAEQLKPSRSGGVNIQPIKAGHTAFALIPERANFEANKQAGVATRYAVDLIIAGKVKLESLETMAMAILETMKRLAKGA